MRFLCRSMRAKGVLRCIPVAALAILAGCATHTPKDTGEFPAVGNPDLSLKPGDEVQVLYTYWPDLDLQQQVRPDGKIALKMIGEVEAEGKTPAQLREELVGLYSDKLKDPDISVVVAGLGSHRVYVGGEVLQPGLIPITGRITLLEAIMQAGGPNKSTARLRDVVLVREVNGQRYAKNFDLRKSFSDPTSESIELQPYDVVFIPRTAIDRIDQWVDQYVNQIVPRNFQATYVWSNPQGAELQRTRSTNVNLGPFTQPVGN